MLTTPADRADTPLFASFDLSSRKSVIAAVSGGSDSTALLLLLKTHLERFAPGTRLVAATVDHGLRAASAAEADGVAALCARHDIEHRILAWTGPKPATGIPAAAREARYDLLASAADAANTDIVLTGHTADDQAETVSMRLERDPGRGLAGIAPVTLFDGRIWIARPLLGVRRATLRDFLSGWGVAWTEDPTNADTAYERPRVRSQLANDAGRFDAAISIALEAGSRREMLGFEAAALVRDFATSPEPGLIRLSPGFLQAGAEASVYALRILLAVSGGMPHLPDAIRTAALHARLAAGTAGRAVLSRTLVDRRRSGVFLLREARNLPSIPIVPEAIWDGRYRLISPSPGLRFARPPSPQWGEEQSQRRSPPPDLFGGGVEQSPLPVGERMAERSGGRVRGRLDTVPASLVRASLACMPPLSAKGGAFNPILAPWARFLPGFDLAPARAVAALIGAPEFPSSPFQRHNAGQP